VTAYYLSVLLVLSFICFEVLDLDGSDFPVPSKSPRIKLAESHDIRRVMHVTTQPWGITRLALVHDHTPLPKPENRQPRDMVRMPTSHRCRITLPRAAPDASAV
jgi:hypothetical protein